MRSIEGGEVRRPEPKHHHISVRRIAHRLGHSIERRAARNDAGDNADAACPQLRREQCRRCLTDVAGTIHDTHVLEVASGRLVENTRGDQVSLKKHAPSEIQCVEITVGIGRWLLNIREQAGSSRRSQKSATGAQLWPAIPEITANTGVSANFLSSCSAQVADGAVNSHTCSTQRRLTLNMDRAARSEEHTSELQSHSDLVCRLLLEKKKT